MERDLENGKYFGSGGFAQIYRNVISNEWLCTNPNRFSLWIHLKLLATHTEQEKVFNGERIKLKPGQLITGTKYLATTTGISQSSVQRILKEFEEFHIIEQQTTSVNRLVTMIYDGSGRESDEPVTKERLASGKRATKEQLSSGKRATSERLHTIRINNDENANNDKKEKNGNNEEVVGASSSVLTRFSDWVEESEDLPDYIEWDSNANTPEELKAKVVLFKGEEWNSVLMEEASLMPAFCTKGLRTELTTTKVFPAGNKPLTLNTGDFVRILNVAKEINHSLLHQGLWRDCNNSNLSGESLDNFILTTKAGNLAEFYHAAAKVLGYSYMAEKDRDITIFMKALPKIMNYNQEGAPTEESLKFWIVWHFASSTPGKTSHRDGLYVSRFVETLDTFRRVMDEFGVNISSWHHSDLETIIPE